MRDMRIHQCVTRWRAATPQQLMASLPRERVTSSRPFLHTGVDYAGPILLRTTKGRGHRAYKAFIAIFVCLSTRAVHLEVVSDYSADAFLDALRRFTSRRGLCRTLRSDCTNFVGADAQLRALFVASNPERRLIEQRLSTEQIHWCFNPPSAPHFGGIWEAVKSVKHHLRRVLGDAILTYEEMSTLLAQVEACLNSRPLQALSDDPDDTAALTPGLPRGFNADRHPGTVTGGSTSKSPNSLAPHPVDARSLLGSMGQLVSSRPRPSTQVVDQGRRLPDRTLMSHTQFHRRDGR